MPDVAPRVHYESAAGLVLEHAGYAELRYLPGKRQEGALAQLLTHLGRLLLHRGWYKFLADNRQMAPFTLPEKAWFVANWLGGTLPRPTPLLGVVVLPLDVVARLAFLELYAQATATSLRYVTFTELAEAQQYVGATQQFPI